MAKEELLWAVAPRGAPEWLTDKSALSDINSPHATPDFSMDVPGVRLREQGSLDEILTGGNTTAPPIGYYNASTGRAPDVARRLRQLLQGRYGAEETQDFYRRAAAHILRKGRPQFHIRTNRQDTLYKKATIRDLLSSFHVVAPDGSTIWLMDFETMKHEDVLTLWHLIQPKWYAASPKSQTNSYYAPSAEYAPPGRRSSATPPAKKFWPVSELQWENGEFAPVEQGGPPSVPGIFEAGEKKMRQKRSVREDVKKTLADLVKGDQILIDGEKWQVVKFEQSPGDPRTIVFLNVDGEVGNLTLPAATPVSQITFSDLDSIRVMSWGKKRAREEAKENPSDKQEFRVGDPVLIAKGTELYDDAAQRYFKLRWNTPGKIIKADLTKTRDDPRSPAYEKWVYTVQFFHYGLSPDKKRQLVEKREGFYGDQLQAAEEGAEVRENPAGDGGGDWAVEWINPTTKKRQIYLDDMSRRQAEVEARTLRMHHPDADVRVVRRGFESREGREGGDDRMFGGKPQSSVQRAEMFVKRGMLSPRQMYVITTLARYPDETFLEDHPPLHGLKIREAITCSPAENGRVHCTLTEFGQDLFKALRAKSPAEEVQENPISSEDLKEAIPWVKVTRDAALYEKALAQGKAIGIIDSPAKVHALLSPALATEDQEIFIVILIDVRGNCRGVAEVHRGTRSRVAVSVPDIMRVAVAGGAEGFIVVHNHPSGNATPSDADGELTEAVKEAATSNEIAFLDHVIVCPGEYYSFGEEKLTKVKGEKEQHTVARKEEPEEPQHEAEEPEPPRENPIAAETPSFSKEWLVEFGEYIWRSLHPFLGGERATDPEIIDAAIAFLGDLENKSSASHNEMTFAVMLQSPDTQAELVGLYRFAEAAYPNYTLGHKLAAALLVTNATPEAVAVAQPPFDGFIIDVPNEMIFIEGMDKKPDEIRTILVARMDSSKGWRWMFRAYSSRGSAMYRWGMTSEMLLTPISEEEAKAQAYGLFQGEVTDLDGRALHLVGRLIINVCLTLSDPANVASKGAGHEWWKTRSDPSKRMRSSGQPRVRLFALTTPVEHDFREAVAGFAHGKRRELTLQHIVAGHYKQQPYGEKRSLRKTIWIQPYPRGPEGAPTAFRTHKLKEEAEAG